MHVHHFDRLVYRWMLAVCACAHGRHAGANHVDKFVHACCSLSLCFRLFYTCAHKQPLICVCCMLQVHSLICQLSWSGDIRSHSLEHNVGYSFLGNFCCCETTICFCRTCILTAERNRINSIEKCRWHVRATVRRSSAQSCCRCVNVCDFSEVTNRTFAAHRRGLRARLRCWSAHQHLPHDTRLHSRHHSRTVHNLQVLINLHSWFVLFVLLISSCQHSNSFQWIFSERVCMVFDHLHFYSFVYRWSFLLLLYTQPSQSTGTIEWITRARLAKIY